VLVPALLLRGGEVDRNFNQLHCHYLTAEVISTLGISDGEDRHPLYAIVSLGL
jgi:hypothetical protein